MLLFLGAFIFLPAAWFCFSPLLFCCCCFVFVLITENLEVLLLAGALLVCFLSNAGEPGEMCSLQLTLFDLKSPQQRGLPVCHLSITVEQTPLFGMLPLLHGKSIAENLL